jgi:hypothetical protein
LLFLFVIVGVEDPSTCAAETLMETSNSPLSTEHQNFPKAVLPRISTSLLEFDSQEVDRDDQGIIKRILLMNQFIMIQKKIFVPRIFFVKIKHKTLHIASNSVTESFYLH